VTLTESFVANLGADQLVFEAGMKDFEPSTSG
jgi:hypothetical protein